MRSILLLFAALLPVAAQAGGVQTVQQYWKSSIEDANQHYAAVPHAILKIQDAAYLRDGDTSTLVGEKGKPETYRWVKGTKAKGVLIAGVRQGHPFVVKDRQLYAEAAIAKGIAVDADVDIMGQQTQVDAGVIGARIFVFNQKNKAAKAFTGLSYFPYDSGFIAQARFAPDPKLATRTFRTSRGTDKQFYHAGDATFALKGKTFTLPFFAETNVPGKITSMSAFFTDGLTGRGTYGAGRYVDVDTFGTYPPKTLPIDFNFAYNPNCARSAYFTCPVALDTLVTDIRAGERDPHQAH